MTTPVLESGQFQLTVHPSSAAPNAEVSASILSAKLNNLLSALRAADEAVNGRSVHDYTISKLHNSSPTLILREVLAPTFHGPIAASSLQAFETCAEAVKLGETDTARRFGQCARRIGKLARGSRLSYGYAEVWTRSDNVVRVDAFLQERAGQIAVPDGPAAIAPDQNDRWYRGAAHGTFQGEVRAVDLRGGLPELKLILSAGGKEIDCVCRVSEVENIRAALDRKVRISGRAIYDGRSGLPRRVEVGNIEILDPPGDISRWGGSFEPFDIPDWDEGEA